MTPEQMAQADREFDLLPGTPPDGWSFRSTVQIEAIGSPHEALRDMVGVWPADYYKRATYLPGGIWLEVWKTRPHKCADFDPPYTSEMR